MKICNKQHPVLQLASSSRCTGFAFQYLRGDTVGQTPFPQPPAQKAAPRLPFSGHTTGLSRGTTARADFSKAGSGRWGRQPGLVARWRVTAGMSPLPRGGSAAAAPAPVCRVAQRGC